MKKKVYLIANPAAGGSNIKNINTAFKTVRAECADAELLLSQKPHDAEQFAAQIAALHKSSPAEDIMVIAAGGDGTYNEAANGLIHSGIPLAILPMGTTSVLALELGIPFDIKAAVKTALNGFQVKISPAKITLSNSISRHFILMAGIGYDGKTVCNVNTTLKKISGKAAYIISGISTLISKQDEFGAVLTDVDGNVRSIKCGALIASKVSCYAGRFSATPDSDITKHGVYVFAGLGSGRIDAARYVFGIATGTHLKYKDIEYTAAQKIEISGMPHIQIDGDYLGRGPAVIESVADALSLVVPGSFKK
ncbi:MAG: hypothetical protein JXR79_01205 [Nitrospirae bacterium]|nr:hypothetical protein [Nitrospirota bacterium]